jgi:exosortase/archaeosortase family protein
MGKNKKSGGKKMKQLSRFHILEFFRKNPIILDVLIFAGIILGFHFFYRAWANWWCFWPLKDVIVFLRDQLADLLFMQSTWLDTHLLGLDLIKEDRKMIFPGYGYISINLSCSGFKQMMQFLVLMLVFPGPWKHKLWFIPLGFVVVQLTNLFRITGLSLITIHCTDYWHFAHDNLFRPFFYVMMFLMWVWWVEKFKGKKQKNTHIQVESKSSYL